MFGQQSLMAVDDLPGAADEDIVSDEQLEKLKKAFANTRYAGREPVGVERGFSVLAVVREATGRERRAEDTLLLQASCYDEESEEDVEVPTIAYRVVCETAAASGG